MKISNDEKEVIELISNNDMALIYFSGENCGVCSVIKSKVQEALKKYPKIKSLEVKTEKSQKIAAQYNIFTIPAILIYIDGKESIREARYVNLEDLENKIKRYYYMIYN